MQLCSKHTYLHIMEYLITTLNIKERSCQADVKRSSQHFFEGLQAETSPGPPQTSTMKSFETIAAMKLLLQRSPSRMFKGVLATRLKSSMEKLWTGKEIKICISKIKKIYSQAKFFYWKKS